jgi:RNA polymerase sigma-70 factor (ECF subfamily)
MDEQSDEAPDEALMARVAGGDEQAFRALARRHVPRAIALARRILGNSADAEDVAQDAMLRVWTNAPRWQPLASFRTWLTRIVVNLCLDRKRRVPFSALEAAGDIVDPAPDAAAQHETSDTGRLVDSAIAALPARQRAAIVLTYREGLSNAQTAEVLDTTVKAVETLLVRAKQSLRGTLGPKLDRD